jgi:hypothetical protein
MIFVEQPYDFNENWFSVEFGDRVAGKFDEDRHNPNKNGIMGLTSVLWD